MDVRTIRQKINIFNGVLDKDCSHKFSVEKILDAIRDGRWKDAIEEYRQETDKDKREVLKKNFPGVTFSGTFNESRKDSNLSSYTGILVIDIDKKDLNIAYEEALWHVVDTPFVFCAFKSPSGGIKALAYSTMKSDMHKWYFKGVEEYFKDNYGIQIDASGKNPGRLCFISYDPNMYIDLESKRAFELSMDAPKTSFTEISDRFQPLQEERPGYIESDDVRYIMNVAKGWAENGVGAYRKGNRNNYVFCLSCIFNRAGVDKDIALDAIFQTYQSLGFEEVKRTVYSAYRHNENEFGSRPILKKDTGQQKML
jgi:predicted RNA-binding protein YlxR (DUF448 family)